MRMSAPIRELLKVKVDPESGPTRLTKTERGNLGGSPPDRTIYHPEGIMSIEDFFAGDIIQWSFHHAEFQYILKGNAELVYTLPPWHDEKKTMTVSTGDAFLIPKGADVTFSIGSGAPLRKLCVVMPAEMSYVEVRPKNRTQI